jgi:hypothetical protein
LKQTSVEYVCPLSPQQSCWVFKIINLEIALLFPILAKLAREGKIRISGEAISLIY